MSILFSFIGIIYSILLISLVLMLVLHLLQKLEDNLLINIQLKLIHCHD